MNSELLSTREAAALLNVTPSTVKRWADDGRLQCVRTAGGHRRFRRADVQVMLGQGESAGGIQLSSERILEDRDGNATLAWLLEQRSSYGSWTAVADRVGEYLVELGEEWAKGEISIVEEHRISERILRALAAVVRSLPTRPGAPLCVFVMAEDDEHTLGLRLAELVACEAGWMSLWIGRKTPLSELEAPLANPEVRALALSASVFSSDEIALRRQVETVMRLAQAAEVPVAIGGEGAWPDAPGGATRVRSLAEFRAFLDSQA